MNNVSFKIYNEILYIFENKGEHKSVGYKIFYRNTYIHVHVILNEFHYLGKMDMSFHS